MSYQHTVYSPAIDSKAARLVNNFFKVVRGKALRVRLTAWQLYDHFLHWPTVHVDVVQKPGRPRLSDWIRHDRLAPTSR